MGRVFEGNGNIVQTTMCKLPYVELSQLILSDLSDSDLAAAEQLFSHSYFILPSMLPTWRAAIRALREKKYAATIADSCNSHRAFAYS